MNTADIVELARCRELAASGGARAIRESAGVSRAEVAAAIGVTSAAVSLWELGYRVPHGEPALRYAKLLDALVTRRSRRASPPRQSDPKPVTA